MQFRDLGRQYEHLKTKIDQAVQEVLTQGHYISGPQVKRLEEQLAQFVGVKHCISCGNGTDALSLVLRAWKIGQGDAVFVPDFTFFASAEAIRDRGAIPIFVDVQKDTFNMNPDDLQRCVEAVISAGTLTPKAIISVDLFGLPADYVAIEAIAKTHDLLLLEDGAQGFGGMQKGRHACGFGDAGITSFFPAKPLGCYGDGGAIFTNDDALATLIRSYAVHGKGSDKYDNVRIGVNSRLDTMQAAILEVKLEAFISEELALVQKAAQYYHDHLADVVTVPKTPEGSASSFAQYSILLPDEGIRSKVMTALQDEGIPSMIYYQKRMSDQTAFADIQDVQVSACPVAKAHCQTVLALPIHPYITKEEQDLVIDVIRKTV